LGRHQAGRKNSEYQKVFHVISILRESTRAARIKRITVDSCS
jgi:hypothetical protein